MAGAEGAAGSEDLALASLPSICRHFNAPTGCRRPDCRALHVCFYFVTGQCRFGLRCRLPHSLETGRTAALLRQHGWPAGRRPPPAHLLLAELRRRHGSSGADSSAAPGEDRLRVCLHYNGSGCLAVECGSLHLCYLHVTDRCRGLRCRRSHSLTTVHNARVLQLRGLKDAAVPAMLGRLRREAAERPLRPAVCRRYNSRDGCPTGDCLQLHCCFYFARGDCAYGARCRFDHRLSSSHNQRVLRFFDQEEADALLAIREELASTGRPSAVTGGADQEPAAGRAGQEQPAAGGAGQEEPAEQPLALLAAETARLLDQRDQLERTLRTVVQLSSETERELAGSRQAGRQLQAEAEHVSLVAQERERQLSQRQGSLLAERDSLELSLLATAESGEQLESVVSGLNAKLSVLEVDYQRSQQEQQRLTAALEQERRLQRERQEQRDQELERTLICSVCLEMFVTATTLGCSHTFCRDCVTSVQRHGGGALCPMCRAPIRSQTPSITLDQMVERAVNTMDEEKRAARRTLLRERGLPDTAGQPLRPRRRPDSVPCINM